MYNHLLLNFIADDIPRKRVWSMRHVRDIFRHLHGGFGSHVCMAY